MRFSYSVFFLIILFYFFAYGVFYPDFYNIILSSSRLKHVHLSKCFSMMKICWPLEDKIISFRLPAAVCPGDKWDHEHANTWEVKACYFK